MGSRVYQGRLSELAVLPELEPVEVVGAYLDVVVEARVLEEELSVAPEGVDLVGAGRNPAN